jgi:hypothetical protein
MTHLDTLIRAGRRLARDLTEIDAAVRVIQSRPDWLAAAEEELGFIQRSLELSLDRVRRARTRYAALAMGKCEFCGVSLAEGRHGLTWCISAEDYRRKKEEAKFHELLAVVETTMGER